MLLRSRNANVQPPAKNADHPVKRGAAKQAVGINDKETGEPKPKRAVLSELRNQISTGLVLDSTRKAAKKEEKSGRSSRRSNSSSDVLFEVQETEKKLDESVVIVENEADPCPNYDFDAENAGDPFNVPEFAFDIFRYYRSRESAFAVTDYMTKHPKMNRDARAVLVDWMIEIQETFELNHETLYLAVKLVDLYICRTSEKVTRGDLQLIACAAVFIASKYDERQPPLIDDFLYVAEDSFTRDALEEMEKNMLKTVSFDLGCPLSYRYLRRYAKTSKANMQVLTLARYILETSLMYFDFAMASEAKVAAGAFLLALRMLGGADSEWTAVLHKYSGLRGSEVEPWCWELCHMMHVRASGQGVNAKLQTAHQKYSHEVFFQSATIPLLEDRFPLSRPIQLPPSQPN